LCQPRKGGIKARGWPFCSGGRRSAIFQLMALTV
jgi:hypothetical protein